MAQSPISPLAALICTHKRGAGLALFPLQGQTVEEAAQRAAHALMELSRESAQTVSLSTTGAAAHVLDSDSELFWFSVCSGLTAENLADLYRLGLSELNAVDATVGVLSVVVGPGSFTGLRLGCAFANGLSLGRPRSLWALEALSPREVENRTRAVLPDVSQFFLGESSSDAEDPFAVVVSFADLLAHLVRWHDGGGRTVPVVEPLYGRDPTPVIKLRQQQGSPLQ